MKRTTLWFSLMLAAAPLLYLSVGCSFTPGTFCTDCEIPPEESFPNSYMCACDCAPGARTRSLRIPSGADDSEELVADGTIERASLDIDLIDTRIVGLRFPSVGIPPGVQIESAHVQFTSSQDDAGTVSVTIHGDAALDADGFATSANDLSSRALTTQSVAWDVPAWTADGAGAAEQTPDLAPILQEIIDQPGWAETNAVAFLIYHAAGGGRRHAYSFNARPDLAAQLVVTFTDPNAASVPIDLQTCMLAEHNPNLGGTADVAALEADCTGRVQPTLSGIAGACGYPSVCTCALVADSTRFAASCDNTCNEVPTTTGCTNFNPILGMTGATNAPGDDPVCAVDEPLSFYAFSRRSTCEVTGEVQMDVEDETVTPGAAGIVEISGFCPGQSCPVGIHYQLDIDNVTVGNFFKSATFTDLASIGRSLSGQEALLSDTGEGTFGPDSTDSSSRGARGSDQRAIVTTNDDLIDVTATFGAADPTCSLDGALVGAADPELKRCESFGPSADLECENDDECEDVAECSDEVCNCEAVSSVDMTMQLAVAGNIVNQPPTAVAADQTVECNQFNGSRLTLDGTGSSDFENNIVLYSWLLGDRAGDEVGFEPLSSVEQAVGAQSYVLRVIDAFARSDETTVEVTVEDSTPPVLACNNDPTVTPPQIPISYTATAEDVCDPDLVPEITGYDCFKFNNKGQKVDKTDSCKVSFAGDTLTIAHSGGVGTIITWDVTVTDAGGNTTTDTCQVLAVRQ